MSDEVDRANESQEILLAAARLRRRPTLPAVGRCYNCDEPITRGQFCDTDCRDDHEKAQRK